MIMFLKIINDSDKTTANLTPTSIFIYHDCYYCCYYCHYYHNNNCYLVQCPGEKYYVYPQF